MKNDRVDNEYDEDSGVFTHSVIGDPDPDEVIDAVEWRNRLLAANHLARIIWDLTEAHLKSADTDRLMRVFQNTNVQLPGGGGRIAVVAPTALEFGRSRQYEALASEHPYEIKVFYSMTAAEQWLTET